MLPNFNKKYIYKNNLQKGRKFSETLLQEYENKRINIIGTTCTAL